MGRDILVGERNCETVDCKRMNSMELHGEWCSLDVTGGLNGKGIIGG